MKTKLPPIFFVLWLAGALALAPALRAQETPPAPAQPAEDKPAVVVPADDTKKTEPAAAADEEKKPAEAAASDDSDKSDKEMRELAADPSGGSSRRRHHSDNARVGFGQDSTLAAGEKADAVVSIIGSSTSAGDVDEAVVSIVGNTRVTGGTVGEAAVSVLGDTYVNGHVRGDVVAVLGNVELGPDAVVEGQIVHVGGELKRDAKAVVHGPIQNIAIGGRMANFDGLSAWFKQCFLYARPLAFGEHLGWAWSIAIAFLVFYALLALVVPGGVAKCVETLEERPGYSLLAAVLTLLLTPVVFILLVLTLAIGIGFALIPLFSLGLFFAGLFGKVVMLAWLGRRITKLLGNPSAPAVLTVLIGGGLALLLYTIPVAGFIIYKLMGVLGLGVVVYTLLLMVKANRAVAAAKVAAVAAAQSPAMETAAAPVAAVLPPVISAATLPRAGFWIRLIASLLDTVIVALALGLLHSIWHGLGGIPPFWYTVYCIVMWATKGTTIGGIVCGLKVVRLDDRPIDWTVALVRGLSAFLSLAIAGFGFIWVAFDNDKQSWHDKIAGTTIVRVPKGTALL